MNGRGTPSDPLRGLVPAGAPPELKARVLAASRAALLAGPAPRDPWTRLWESGPLRLAWAASVLLLLAAHALLVRPAPPPIAAAAAPAPRGASGTDSELAAIARLPQIDPDARAFGVDDPPLRTRPSALETHKENRS